MEKFEYKTKAIVTDIDRNAMHDHHRSIYDYMKNNMNLEIVCTDTTYIPKPNRNSLDKGELLTIITYKEPRLML